MLCCISFHCLIIWEIFRLKLACVLQFLFSVNDFFMLLIDAVFFTEVKHSNINALYLSQCHVLQIFIANSPWSA